LASRVICASALQHVAIFYSSFMVPPRRCPDRLELYFRRSVGGAGFFGTGEMATERENQSLGERHRRVLAVLAKAPRGRDVNALLTRGFRFDTIADLISRGLATVELQSMGRREPNVRVACVKITDAGRRAMEGAAESA
jgi:hypothetical protein